MVECVQAMGAMLSYFKIQLTGSLYPNSHACSSSVFHHRHLPTLEATAIHQICMRTNIPRNNPQPVGDKGAHGQKVIPKTFSVETAPLLTQQEKQDEHQIKYNSTNVR